LGTLKNSKEIGVLSWIVNGVLYYGGSGGYYSGRAKFRRKSAAYKFDEAYRMRHNPTPAEARMWEILKYQVMPKFPNHIFRRQYVHYGYILDFYCPTLQLAIEVDGGIHNEQREYDRTRDSHLSRHGIKVYRFQNTMVFNESEFVASELCRIIEEKTTPWFDKVIRYFGRFFGI
jgi:very-short-patch-repair endonuclease